MNLQRILPVIVVYRASDDANCSSFNSLRAASSERIQVFVYDNSPVATEPFTTQDVVYHHDPSNGGLSAAYNAALSYAAQEGYQWLLLLDQDSELLREFVDQVHAATCEYASREDVVAIVPHVFSGNRHVSPSSVSLGELRPYSPQTTGIASGEITAINSGAVLRVSFLKSLGGFDARFWLDYLDHWLFRRIYCEGKKVLVLPATINHDLSVCEYRTQVSAARYRSILNAELEYMTRERPVSEALLYVAHLCGRVLRQCILLRRFDLVPQTLISIPKALLQLRRRGGMATA
jgi:GT2 family glycosyltransferase